MTGLGRFWNPNWNRETKCFSSEYLKCYFPLDYKCFSTDLSCCCKYAISQDPPPQHYFINYSLQSGNFHTLKCGINKLCSLLQERPIKPVSRSFTLLVPLIWDCSEVHWDTMEILISFLGNIFHVMASCFQPTS